MATSDQRKKGKCEQLTGELSIVWIEEAVSPEICYKPKENKHTRGFETLDDPASILQSASQSSESTNIRCRRRYGLEFKK